MQGWISLGLLYVLKGEMGLGCCFGMISGAGNSLLKFNFPIFLEWHAREMLQCMSYLGMGVSLGGILLSQEDGMIGKRKAFSIYHLYLQIGMWMFMLREKIRLFGLLNQREPSLSRVYVRGCSVSYTHLTLPTKRIV